MAEKVPVLLGVAGLVDGEVYLLSDGVEVVLGRSRSCPISLRRAANYLRASPASRDNDHDFNTVSRRHLRLTVRSALAEIEDISSNGSFCNGEAMTGPMRIDLSLGPCQIRLGTREKLELVLLDPSDPRLADRVPVNSQPVEPAGTEG